MRVRCSCSLLLLAFLCVDLVRCSCSRPLCLFLFAWLILVRVLCSLCVGRVLCALLFVLVRVSAWLQLLLFAVHVHVIGLVMVLVRCYYSCYLFVLFVLINCSCSRD